MKKTYLMFALLLSLMGVNGALADSVTDDFTSYSATSSGQTLGDNWYVYPGEDGSYGRFGSDYIYKKMNTTVQISIMCLDTAQITPRMFGWY